MSEAAARPKVIFDCNIFLQSIIKETGPAVACLELFESGAIELFVSEDILRELRAVLTRPKLQARYSRLTDERAATLVEMLSEEATLIAPIPHKFSYSRDPKDEPYLNLALAARADYLVSWDNDLLALMTGYSNECKEFRQRSRPLKVVDPVIFLALLTKR